MKFRPCIDIHKGKVKQIVGSSLRDENFINQASVKENFVSGQNAAFYAQLYRSFGLKGGHVIVLDPPGSEAYEESRRQAFAAFRSWPGGLQAGGGITPDNAEEFLKAGASHVIVTSYVFRDGMIDYDRLKAIRQAVGRERLSLDLSCRKNKDRYFIVTDRWQKYTKEELRPDLLDRLSGYCDEFLVHAVDREGKSQGIEEAVAGLLGAWGKQPVTYAGGVHSFEDLDRLRQLGRERVDVTVGSALDLFGGPMKWSELMDYMGLTDRVCIQKEPV